MRRREFMTLIGGAAAWPVAVRAQANKVTQIGFLGGESAVESAGRVEGFRLGLRDFGYVEGTNLVITYRWAEGNYERLPGLAAELVRSRVDVIVTAGTPGSLAAKQATTTIPIVIANIGDPVATGIVASIARPGGNITGQSFFSPELAGKRIELLKELMPQLTGVAVLLNPDNRINRSTLQVMGSTAEAHNVELQQFLVRRPSEIESAFERMEKELVLAVAIDDDGMLAARLEEIAKLATKRRLLSIGPKEFAQAGGVMGYGADRNATYRQAARIVDKIIKGIPPADIPIEQATKLDFVVNLKSAKVLGIDVPPILLVRADEVIE
jgi:putative tryptophan/tyrosine transport system substrate-binding protein